MTTLYLIRHGTTDSNLAGVFQGSMDVPLNERGLSQAALLARRFEKVHLDKIYVSALQRARQTGEALAIVRAGETGRVRLTATAGDAQGGAAVPIEEV